MVTRRLFLATLGRTAAGSALLPPAAAVSAPLSALACFDAATAAFVAAACNCLIPNTASSPGATVAGVMPALDRRLSGTWETATAGSRDDGWPAGGVLPRRPTSLTPARYCRTAVHAIRALLGDGREFEAQDVLTQRRVLEELQRAPLDLDGVPSDDFVDLLLTLCVAVYFSRPEFSATRDRIHWPLSMPAGGHMKHVT